MDVGSSSLPDSIHPNSFPAKLWRMVNDPLNEAICWDSLGEVIIIHKQLFLRQILCANSSSILDKADRFRTTNFSSFLRQLNLYGFKQTDPAIKHSPSYNHGTYFYYSNKNFKQNNPGLVASLRTLTFNNKDKVESRLEIRSPSRHLRDRGDGDGKQKDLKKVKSMEFGTSSLPDTIDPNSFPAKLWRMVNDQFNEAICWDSLGEVIIIHKQLFLRQILCANSSSILDKADRFRTTNFSSFLRQLNLYGFKQTDAAIKHSPNYNHGTCLYYTNTNFRRNNPELVASLGRLTFHNKAKLKAGMEVRCRPPPRHQRDSGRGDGKDIYDKKGTAISSHLQPPHPYHAPRDQAWTALNGEAVPPQCLIRGYGDGASSSSTTESSSHHAQHFSSSNAAHVQPTFLTCATLGSPNYTGFNAYTAPDQPGYTPFYYYYHPDVAPHMTGSGPQTAPFPTYSYQELQNTENQLVDFDTIFQITDEVIQTPSSNCIVKVETAEEAEPVLGLSSSSCNPTQWSYPASTMETNPLFAQPIAMALLGNVNLATYVEQEKSVVSVTRQMPEDAIL